VRSRPQGSRSHPDPLSKKLSPSRPETPPRVNGTVPIPGSEKPPPDKHPSVICNADQGTPRELANVAATEEYEGKRQQWTQILEGELAKARDL
jgi:hypothetical protein